MTGQELIDYIQNGNLEEAEIFVAAQGRMAGTSTDNIIQINNDIILGCIELNKGKFVNRIDMYEYFSKWFNIIPVYEAAKLWENGNKNFYILHNDGTDHCADGYKDYLDILYEVSEDAMIGLEKGE